MEECRKQLHVAQAVLTLDAFENQGNEKQGRLIEECRKQLHVAHAVLTLEAFENQGDE